MSEQRTTGSACDEGSSRHGGPSRVPQNELITRLGAGGQSGRAATAEKALERMREEGLVGKPFVPKKRSFAFPSVERMGCALALRMPGVKLPFRPRAQHRTAAG